MNNYNKLTVRESAILTTSYVDSTILGPDSVNPQYNKTVAFFINVTIGSLTSLEVTIYGSADGTNYVNIGNAKEISYTASGIYVTSVPATVPYMKIAVKGTGTVTNSLCGIIAICSDAPFPLGQLSRYDAAGNQSVTQGTVPFSEDLTNGVVAYVRKPLASATYAPLDYAPLVQVTKAVIKSSAGNLYSVYVTNDNAAVRFLQFHNKATAPAAGEAPLEVFKIPAGTANNPGVLILDEAFFARGGDHFTIGIGFAISTTMATFTDSATASEHIINVHYF